MGGTYEMALQPGSVLQGLKYKYIIDRVLGQGTFGITYLARTMVTVAGDLGQLRTEIQVAVKEFAARVGCLSITSASLPERQATLVRCAIMA